MKTKTVCALVVVLCMQLLAGCGGGSDRAASRSTAAPTPGTAATSPVGTVAATAAATATVGIATTPTGGATEQATASPTEAQGAGGATAVATEAQATEVPVITVVPAPTEAATPDPTETPVVAEGTPKLPEGYTLFESQVLPYTIGVPPGWVAQAGAIKLGKIKGDVFARQSRGQLAASINVLAEQFPPRLKLTDKQYLELSLANLQQQFKTKAKRAGRTAVGDKQAYLITYSRAGAEITQAVWVAGNKGWVATLAHRKGEKAKYLPIFKRVLETFSVGKLKETTTT